VVILLGAASISAFKFVVMCNQIFANNFANEIITKVSYKDDLLIITNYVSYFITFLRKCLSTSPYSIEEPSVRLIMWCEIVTMNHAILSANLAL